MPPQMQGGASARYGYGQNDRVVSYDNACIPEMGPPTRERRPCGGGTEINVAIMAESGEYLQAFAYR